MNRIERLCRTLSETRDWDRERHSTVLVELDHGIGLSACEAACPIEAIQPVFGTEPCGIDLPFVTPRPVRPTMSDLFIVGELGGMGLIHKGVEQGARAIASIYKNTESANEQDGVIVGADPAGSSPSPPAS